ncbi:MAG: hypothetical protein SGARI_002647 [Bacillariaceae sp.]
MTASADGQIVTCRKSSHLASRLEVHAKGTIQRYVNDKAMSHHGVKKKPMEIKRPCSVQLAILPEAPQISSVEGDTHIPILYPELRQKAPTVQHSRIRDTIVPPLAACVRLPLPRLYS